MIDKFITLTDEYFYKTYFDFLYNFYTKKMPSPQYMNIRSKTINVLKVTNTSIKKCTTAIINVSNTNQFLIFLSLQITEKNELDFIKFMEKCMTANQYVYIHFNKLKIEKIQLDNAKKLQWVLFLEKMTLCCNRYIQAQTYIQRIRSGLIVDLSININSEKNSNVLKDYLYPIKNGNHFHEIKEYSTLHADKDKFLYLLSFNDGDGDGYGIKTILTKDAINNLEGWYLDRIKQVFQDLVTNIKKGYTATKIAKIILILIKLFESFNISITTDIHQHPGRYITAGNNNAFSVYQPIQLGKFQIEDNKITYDKNDFDEGTILKIIK